MMNQEDDEGLPLQGAVQHYMLIFSENKQLLVLNYCQHGNYCNNLQFKTGNWMEKNRLSGLFIPRQFCGVSLEFLTGLL